MQGYDRVPARFDSVGHLSLIQKLKALNIADNIIQWVVSFLTDHNQYVQLNGKLSFTRIINGSIVQGSGIGPTLFIICIMDLNQLALQIILQKMRMLLAFWFLRKMT